MLIYFRRWSGKALLKMRQCFFFFRRCKWVGRLASELPLNVLKIPSQSPLLAEEPLEFQLSASS